MPLFSVIIPAYNRAALIGQTLDSVFAQSFADLAMPEVIVVDDGSTDGTLEVVRGFGDRVKVLQQPNKGPGAARNAGLRAASGEYVVFLDSDDLWFPWSAKTYARVIEQHHRPAFIAGKPFVFEPPAPAMPPGPGPLTTEVFTDYYASGDQWRWYSASSFVMKREALLAVGGFTDEWVNGEDADAAMRMGVAGPFVQVTSPCTFGYRRHPDSAMADLGRTYRGMRRMIDEERAGHFPGRAERARDRIRILTTYVRPLSLGLLDRGDRASAWDLYRQTFRWHLRGGRWKFLAGFLGRALTTKLRTGRAT